MNRAPVSSAELLRALPDLAAWTSHFRRAEIPVLRETVEALDALRANEERTDANSIGEMIGGDPLMTLKVLAYASDHRGRSVVTGPETVPVAGSKVCTPFAVIFLQLLIPVCAADCCNEKKPMVSTTATSIASFLISWFMIWSPFDTLNT